MAMEDTFDNSDDQDMHIAVDVWKTVDAICNNVANGIIVEYSHMRKRIPVDMSKVKFGTPYKRPPPAGPSHDIRKWMVKRKK